MPGSTFETAFSEIAHSSLRDTAPALMEHLVGFQIVDKTDDDTRAVGVFGFKIDEQWFYAPVFFVNGTLKGNEILYVKNQDLFVPLQDNWVTYLLSKKAPMLGAAEDREESELNISLPTFNEFSESPKTHKIGSWGKPFAETWKTLQTKEASAVNSLDFHNAFSLHPELAIPLAQAINENTKLASLILETYGDFSFLPHPSKISSDTGENIFKISAEAERELLDDPGPESVEVYTADDISSDTGELLTDKEKEDLMRGEIVIKDNRPEENISRVFKADFETKLHNPDGTGIYNILDNTGSFQKVLLLNCPRPLKEGSSAGVVNIIADDNLQCIAYTNEVFTSDCDTGPDGLSTSNIDEYISKGVNPGSMKIDHKYVAVTKDGKVSTIPFIVERIISSDDGTLTAKVCEDDEIETSSQDPYFENHANYPVYTKGKNRGILTSSASYEDPEVVVTPKILGEGIKASGKTTFISEDKVVLIDLGKRKKFSDNDIPKLRGRLEGFNKFIPGGLDQAEAYIMEKGAQQIEVFRRNNDIIIHHENGSEQLPKTAALRYFIDRWGVGGEDALALVKEAGHHLTQYWIKTANPMLGPGPNAPAIPMPTTGYDSELGVATTQPESDSMPVESLQEQPGAAEAYELMDDPEIGKILEAAGAGKKDILDVTTISNLVKIVDVNSIVDSYLPEIIKGMDRVGRILLMFYWHSEDFRERYGRDEVIELEDGLRNVFKSVGDLVIFLRQKTISADPYSESMEIDIGALS